MGLVEQGNLYLVEVDNTGFEEEHLDLVETDNPGFEEHLGKGDNNLVL